MHNKNETHLHHDENIIEIYDLETRYIHSSRNVSSDKTCRILTNVTLPVKNERSNTNDGGVTPNDNRCRIFKHVTLEPQGLCTRDINSPKILREVSVPKDITFSEDGNSEECCGSDGSNTGVHRRNDITFSEDGNSEECCGSDGSNTGVHRRNDIPRILKHFTLPYKTSRAVEEARKLITRLEMRMNSTSQIS